MKSALGDLVLVVSRFGGSVVTERLNGNVLTRVLRPVSSRTAIQTSARTFGYFWNRVPVGYLNGYPGNFG